MGAIKQYFIAIILFAGIMIAMTGFYGNIITQTQDANIADCSWCDDLSTYDSPISNETRLNESITNITAKIEEMRETSKQFHEWGIIGDFVAILKAGVDAVILSIDSFTISQNIMAEVSYGIGLPSWVSLIAIAIIMTLLVFSLIYVLTGRDA